MMNEKQKTLVTEKWFSVPENLPSLKKMDSQLQLDHDLEIPFRSIFDRDRDRILFSKAFRRLNGKSQIFIPRLNDYVRTRLTHSLEVNQIARSIGKGLGLNISLIEAIALGHDVGHTPFGHAGEYELNRIMNNCLYHGNSGFPEQSKKDCGYKHNFQAIRVLCELETIYGKQGLGLTPFTLWGILHHTSIVPIKCEYACNNPCPREKEYAICLNNNAFYFDFYKTLAKNATYIDDHDAWSFEGIVVNIADEIAQIHHDIEDGLYMNIISLGEAKDYIFDMLFPLIKQNCSAITFNNYDLLHQKIYHAKNLNEFMSYASKLIIDFLISKLIRDSLEKFEELAIFYGIKSHCDFMNHYQDIGERMIYDNEDNLKKNAVIVFDCEGNINKFQNTFKDRVINSLEVQKLNNLGFKIVNDLFKAFYLSPKILPDSTLLYFIGESDDAKMIMEKSGIYKVRSNAENYEKRKKEGLGKLRNEMSNLVNTFEEENGLTNNAIALMRIVADHISGMTDAYALAKHKEIFGTNFGQ